MSKVNRTFVPSKLTPTAAGWRQLHQMKLIGYSAGGN
jgi:hypothetical protein